ncbi:NACHT C-terminal helical domain 2-containing protein [Argonema galeatum]|uniref:NACHT C-terminal helical domain 2-containing protein n=1 Tax=Argonema galeatum TaxID=2942762 RepID=UPI0020136E46|nr:hypothetical protein [Argonema galeatum]MCL1467262.1 hypothetical protein [Argonema galeatum A003/A1]
MQNADDFIRLMKQQADAIAASDENLQYFLSVLNQRYIAVDTYCSRAAIRAFYFALSLALTLYLDDVPGRSTNIARLRGPDLEPDFTLAYKFNLNFNDIPDLNCSFYLAQTLARAFDFISSHFMVYGIQNTRDASVVGNLFIPITVHLHKAFSHIKYLDYELQGKLQLLISQLYEAEGRSEENLVWGKYSGRYWTAQLRVVMIEHRNIGHDWQFNEQQKTLLKQYYDANKLLVDCLNSGCAVSREVRQEIEDTLLLPIAEIEKRQQPIS